MRKQFFRSFLALFLLAAFLCPTAFAESAVVSFEIPASGQAAIIFPDDTVIVDPMQPNTAVIEPTPASPQGPTLATDQNAAAPSSQVTVPNSSNAAIITTSPAAQTQTAAPSSTGTGTPGQITGMYVRFRSGPSSETDILGEYNQGKALTILGTRGDWTWCRIDGQEGYIYSEYVKATSTASAAAPMLATAPNNSQSMLVEFPTVTPTPAPAAAPTLATAAAAQSAQPAQSSQKSGVITGDHVRFRSGPSTDYSILGTYDRGKTLTVLSTLGEWSHCEIDGQDGYVFAQYVQIVETQTAAPAATAAPTLAAAPTAVTPSTYSGPSVGYIKGNNVRFREAPDSSSKILAELFYGNAVTITGVYGSWTAIIYDNQAGYVYSEYVATGSAPAASSAVNGTPTGRELADYALTFVGYPYTWGGKDPSTGFDCSGLMYYVFKHFGYTLNRVASEQAKNGRHVDPSDLQPGDLLCFYSGSSYIGHVGMYIGNNRFVHAGTSMTGVIVSELDGYYVSRGYEARRIIG